MGHAWDLPDPTCHDERRLNTIFRGGGGGRWRDGMTREFMRLALKARRDSPIFEGPDDAKMLAVNIAGNKFTCTTYHYRYIDTVKLYLKG